MSSANRQNSNRIRKCAARSRVHAPLPQALGERGELRRGLLGDVFRRPLRPQPLRLSEHRPQHVQGRQGTRRGRHTRRQVGQVEGVDPLGRPREVRMHLKPVEVADDQQRPDYPGPPGTGVAVGTPTAGWHADPYTPRRTAPASTRPPSPGCPRSWSPPSRRRSPRPVGSASFGVCSPQQPAQINEVLLRRRPLRPPRRRPLRNERRHRHLSSSVPTSTHTPSPRLVQRSTSRNPPPPLELAPGEGWGGGDYPPTPPATKCILPSRYRPNRDLAPPRPRASSASTPPAPRRPPPRHSGLAPQSGPPPVRHSRAKRPLRNSSFPRKRESTPSPNVGEGAGGEAHLTPTNTPTAARSGRAT